MRGHLCPAIVTCVVLAQPLQAALAAPATRPAGQFSIAGASDRARRVAVIIESPNAMTEPDAPIWGELRRSVEALEPAQSFNVLCVFGRGFIAVDRAALLPATAGNKRKANTCIDELSGRRAKGRPEVGVTRELAAAAADGAADRIEPGLRRVVLRHIARRLHPHVEQPAWEVEMPPDPQRAEQRPRARGFRALAEDLAVFDPRLAFERAFAMEPEVIYYLVDAAPRPAPAGAEEFEEFIARLNVERKVRMHLVLLIDHPADEQGFEDVPADEGAKLDALLNGGTVTVVTGGGEGGLRTVAKPWPHRTPHSQRP